MWEPCGNRVGLKWGPRGDHAETIWEPQEKHVLATRFSRASRGGPAAWEPRGDRHGGTSCAGNHAGTTWEPRGDHVGTAWE